MRFISFSIIAIALFVQIACNASEAQQNQTNSNQTDAPKIITKNFAYPIGKTEVSTQAKDKKDDWYNAQDFGENNHLGEDWNKNSGGNTDCGEAVYAIGNGEITYAKDAGTGWGIESQ